jgi:LPXTG-motif cell wall-anchored protein
MMAVIAVLLLVWLVLAVVGALIEGLFWLTIVGAVLFLATAAYGAIKRRRDRQAL